MVGEAGGSKSCELQFVSGRPSSVARSAFIQFQRLNGASSPAVVLVGGGGGRRRRSRSTPHVRPTQRALCVPTCARVIVIIQSLSCALI